MIIKRFNIEKDLKKLEEYLRNQYRENKNMTSWLPERLHDLIYRMDTQYTDAGKESKTAFIEPVSTREKYRHKGIGTAMMHGVILNEGTFEDFSKVYEYDFNYLNNIWNDETKLIKNSSKKIEELYNLINNQEDNTYSWIIYFKGVPVGHIVADRYDKENNSIELSYNLHPDYWGKGIMNEVVERVCRYLKIRYDNIIVSYVSGNEKAKKLIEKMNFRPYKTVKDAWNRDGKYVDEFKFILSKDDMKK